VRRLNVEDLAPLIELTRVRERDAAFKLNQAAALQNEASQRVEELRNNNPKVSSVDQALVLEKWMVWRDQELRQRQMRLAKCRANYAATAKVCGRVIAEHVVVESLRDQADERQKNEREARDLEALNVLSHLLTHDIGDQDI
jgi:hypothetical protein